MFKIFKLIEQNTIIALSLLALFICSCGDLGENADGARFNSYFNYYYAQNCNYDAVSDYNCDDVHSISHMRVSLRIDSDGFATLNLNGDRYYYFENEYSEGYSSDYGSYFIFFEDSDELTLYKDGYELDYRNTQNNTVTYYFYQMPAYYKRKPVNISN